MQIDLLPELRPGGGYEIVITAINVFSKYAFAYTVSNPTANVIVDIMTRHAFLPTVIVTDKGSVFVFQVIHKVDEILGTNLKHATTKYAQTIGVLQRARAKIRTSMKMASGQYRKQWHKYLPIEILNYNTTYQFSLDCEPSQVLYGRVPHNFLDQIFGLRLNPNMAPTTDLQKNYSAEPKPYMTKSRKMSCNRTSNTRYFRTKSKNFTFKRERLLLHTPAKSRPSKVKNTVS